MHSILIVDDHSYARSLLREIVHSIFEHAVIEEAATVSYAKQIIKKTKL